MTRLYHFCRKIERFKMLSYDLLNIELDGEKGLKKEDDEAKRWV